MIYFTYSYDLESHHLIVGCFHSVATLAKVAVKFHAGSQNKLTSFNQEVITDTRETVIECLQKICNELRSEYQEDPVINTVTFCADVNLGCVGGDHIADLFLDQTIPKFFKRAVVYLELESGTASIVENANHLIQQNKMNNINVRTKGTPRNQTPITKHHSEHRFFPSESQSSASPSASEEIVNPMDLASQCSEISLEISPEIWLDSANTDDEPFTLNPINLEEIHNKHQKYQPIP